MNQRHRKLEEDLRAWGKGDLSVSGHGELTLEVGKADWVSIATELRDRPEFEFDTMIDLCGVDYLTHGQAEWQTEAATGSGFSRGVSRDVIADYQSTFSAKRFGVVVHLLSVTRNLRLRLRAYTGTENPPMIESLTAVWAGANWFEREAFDLYGILFEGHPDLRRLLTDYGFIGHPFRKDFPLSGNVEVRYDPELGRVAYQAVTIEERTLVPRVIRDDNRYDDAIREEVSDG